MLILLLFFLLILLLFVIYVINIINNTMVINYGTINIFFDIGIFLLSFLI